MLLLSRLYRAGVLAVLFFVSMHVRAEETQTVLIGFAGPLSGISELFGKSTANAAELAIEEANRNPYKIDGKRILFRLVRMDDGGDPERAQQVAAIMVQAGVIGVIGGSNSTTSIASAKVYAAAGVAQISPAATSRKFTDLGYRTTFRTVGGDDEASPYIADYVARDLHANRIAVISNGSTFSTGNAAQFVNAARNNGATIVLYETVGLMESNFDNLLRQIKAQHTDAIFFSGYTAQSSVFAQSMLRLEVRARLVTSMMGNVGRGFFIATGVSANGVLAQEPGLPFHKMPGWRKFEADFTQRFGFNMYALTPFSYDAAKVLIAAARKANSVNAGKIVDSLHEINHTGLTGNISFDAKGNLKHPSFTIYEAQNEKWVAMKSNTVR